MVSVRQCFHYNSATNWLNYITLCRVVVQKSIGGAMLLVSYCDFGDVDVVKANKLRVLPADFRSLPELAIQARLTGSLPIFDTILTTQTNMFLKLFQA